MLIENLAIRHINYFRVLYRCVEDHFEAFERCYEHRFKAAIWVFTALPVAGHLSLSGRRRSKKWQRHLFGLSGHRAHGTGAAVSPSSVQGTCEKGHNRPGTDRADGQMAAHRL
jgi:hypothetical protein